MAANATWTAVADSSSTSSINGPFLVGTAYAVRSTQLGPVVMGKASIQTCCNPGHANPIAFPVYRYNLSPYVTSLQPRGESDRRKDAKVTKNRMATLMKISKDGEGHAFVGLITDHLKTLSSKNDPVVFCDRLKKVVVKKTVCGLCLQIKPRRTALVSYPKRTTRLP